MDVPKRVGLSDMEPQRYLTFGSLFILMIDSALYPIDTIKTIIMADRRKKMKSGKNYKSPGLFKLTSQIAKREGIARFWRGMVPSVVGSFPGQAFYYLALESAQEVMGKLLPKRDKESELEVFLRACAEVAGGMFYVPADIVAQRLQIQQVQGFVHNSRLYSGTSDVIKKIWRAEGVRGFFRGYFAYVTAYAPGSAVQWGTYEFAKGIFYTGATFVEQRLNYTTPHKETIVNMLSGGLAATCAIIANNPLEILRIRTQLLESKNKKDMESIKQGYIRLASNILREEGWHGP
ncbi:mitochondrial carrier domain-containing protein [Gorgonomyces haynaldii]|nr:mitochondrial carrier domain-containing protein [Gorgonomyces haynaldii]